MIVKIIIFFLFIPFYHAIFNLKKIQLSSINLGDFHNKSLFLNLKTKLSPFPLHNYTYVYTLIYGISIYSKHLKFVCFSI